MPSLGDNYIDTEGEQGKTIAQIDRMCSPTQTGTVYDRLLKEKMRIEKTISALDQRLEFITGELKNIDSP